MDKGEVFEGPALKNSQVEKLLKVYQIWAVLDSYKILRLQNVKT